MRFKRLIWYSIFFVGSLFLLIWVCNEHINDSSKDYLYNTIDAVPAAKVGLVLGTSKNTKGGSVNLYFKYRIDAAAKLYKAGKVRYLLVSGDNHTKTYDEPEDMKQALIAAGVPDSCIFLDYAGFRTFDSIIRCWKVFGQSQFIVISQPFHNERAIFIGRHYGLWVSAYNAEEVTKSYGLRTHLREYLARVKAVFDVYIFNTKPKFLGEQVEIGG